MQTAALTGLFMLGSVIFGWQLRQLWRQQQAVSGQLQQSEKRYRNIVESQTEFVERFLPGGVMTYVNEALVKYSGVKAEDLLGKSFYPYVYENDREELRRKIEAINFENPVVETESRNVLPDGTVRWIHWTQSGIFDEHGKLIEYQAVGQDITERKAAEFALLEHDKMLKMAQYGAGAGCWDWCFENESLKWTDELFQIFGLDPKSHEASFATWRSIIHPDDYDTASGNIELAIKNRLQLSNEYRVVLPDGQIRWISALGNTTYDAAGNPVRMTGICFDITERKENEKLLQESEKLYSSLFTNMLNGFAFCRMLYDNGKPHDFVYLAVNETFSTLTGLQDVVGKKVSEVIPGIRETDPQLLETYGRVATTGQPERFETFLEALQMWFAVSVYCPKPEHFVSVFEAITDRKMAEERLKEAKERFQLVIDGSQLGLWDWDMATGMVTRNERWAEMLGYTPQEIDFSVKQWSDFVHPDDQARAWQSIQDHLDGRTPEHACEYRMLTKDGQCRWILDRAKIVQRDQQGKPLRMCGTHSDITDRKNAEVLLHEREEKLRAILKTSIDGIWVADSAGHLLEVNDAYCKMVGYSEQELLSMTISDLEADMDSAAVAAHARLLIEQGSARFESRHRRKDGTIIDIDVSAMYQSVDGGRFISFKRDITDRKHAEEEMLKAKAAAEAANIAKSEFLANMSHEIRTPMNGVIGMAQLLRFTNLTDEQKEYLSCMEFSARNLMTLISDILDLAKIEAGKVKLEYVDFSLVEAVNEVISMQIAEIRRKQLKIQVHIPLSVPAKLFGDQFRVKQILLNLLGNAIKFTKEGEVSISAEVREKHDNQVLIDIAVIDTGIGISEDNIDKIFSPFTQADGSTTRKYGGTGLGLAICIKLAHLLGGSITVESSEGIGSSFHLIVPFTVSSVSPDDLEIAASSKELETYSLRVLLAEDNELSIKFGKALLKILGMNVDIVEDGAAALTAWEKNSYDVILMDIQMPIMNGDEVTSIIRQKEQDSGKRIPIIAVTAYALKGEKERYMQAGFDGYVTKPFTTETLVAEMKRVMVTTYG